MGWNGAPPAQVGNPVEGNPVGERPRGRRPCSDLSMFPDVRGGEGGDPVGDADQPGPVDPLTGSGRSSTPVARARCPTHAEAGRRSDMATGTTHARGGRSADQRAGLNVERRSTMTRRAGWTARLVTTLAVILALTGGARPAAADDLVTNLSTSASGREGLADSEYIQSFTTGPNASGYLLESISIDFSRGAGRTIPCTCTSTRTTGVVGRITPKVARSRP